MRSGAIAHFASGQLIGLVHCISLTGIICSSGKQNDIEPSVAFLKCFSI